MPVDNFEVERLVRQIRDGLERTEFICVRHREPEVMEEVLRRVRTGGGFSDVQDTNAGVKESGRDREYSIRGRYNR